MSNEMEFLKQALEERVRANRKVLENYGEHEAFSFYIRGRLTMSKDVIKLIDQMNSHTKPRRKIVMTETNENGDDYKKVKKALELLVRRLKCHENSLYAAKSSLEAEIELFQLAGEEMSELTAKQKLLMVKREINALENILYVTYTAIDYFCENFQKLAKETN